MNNLIDFFKIVEHLHYEKRTTQMSNGEKESVSAHSFMMSLMAMTFLPYIPEHLNIEKILKLCTAHDLAESKVHDIPLHEQIKSNTVCKNKKDCEALAIQELSKLSDNNEFENLWQEYENQTTPESRFVRALDKLEVDIQVMCSKTLEYVGEYDNNIYWKIYFSKSRAEPYYEFPVLLDFFHSIQNMIKSRIQTELNINPDDFKE